MTEECIKKNTNERIVNAFGRRLDHWTYYINDVELIHTEHRELCHGQVHEHLMLLVLFIFIFLCV